MHNSWIAPKQSEFASDYSSAELCEGLRVGALQGGRDVEASGFALSS